MRSRFLALTLIWGASFLFIKVAVQSLAPIQVAFARMLFGSLALLAFIAARRDRLPRDARLWARLAFAAALLNVVPFTLFAYAQRHVPSALASIGNATTPLWTGLFALFLLPDERDGVRSPRPPCGFPPAARHLERERPAERKRDVGATDRPRFPVVFLLRTTGADLQTACGQAESGNHYASDKAEPDKQRRRNPHPQRTHPVHRSGI